MKMKNIQINDRRENLKVKILCDLIYGECFIYKEQLYINMDYTASIDLIYVYNLYSCNIDYLPSEAKVTPVKIEINIIE